MSWILDGQRVKATYYGIPVVGVVTHSRVKYGGEVHRLKYIAPRTIERMQMESENYIKFASHCVNKNL